MRLRLVPSRTGWGVADAFPDEEQLRRASVASVVVGVHDGRRRTPVLQSSLPEGWSTVAVALATDDEPAEGPRPTAVVPGGCDVLLLVDPPAAGIRAARAAAGLIPVVVLLTAEVSASRVVEVLQAGADSCVRGIEPAAVVVAHLRACLRRGGHR